MVKISEGVQSLINREFTLDEVVVVLSSGFVAEDFVCLTDILELFVSLQTLFSSLFGMMINREIVVGLVYLILSGFMAYTENCIVVLDLLGLTHLSFDNFIRFDKSTLINRA
jgi:hypothetical protein